MAVYESAFLVRLRLLACSSIQQECPTWLDWYAQALERVDDPAKISASAMVRVVKRRAKVMRTTADACPVSIVSQHTLAITNKPLLETCLYWFALRPLVACELRDDLTSWGASIYDDPAAGAPGVRMLITHASFAFAPDASGVFPEADATRTFVRPASPFYSSSPVGLIDA